jgi:methylthioribose-1-phosphate isomerase
MALFSVGLSESYPALRRAETSLFVKPMKIDGKEMRTIWVESDGASIGVIDQPLLPHRFATARLTTLDDAARAIKTMQVRGAPLIGAAAAYGVWLALRADASPPPCSAPRKSPTKTCGSTRRLAATA